MNTAQPLRWHTALAALLLMVAGGPVVAQQNTGCGHPREMGFERDYRLVPREARLLVENFHFTPEVEALVRGKSGSIVQDVSYTLRHFPNHPRALVSMMRLGERVKTEHLPTAPYSIDCYFKRAVQLAPDDGIVRTLYASFLFSKNRVADANLQVDKARELASGNGLTHYNIGLVLIEHKQWDRALEQAHEALALGFPRPELKDRLVAAGKWREPLAPADAASGPTAASAPTPAAAASGAKPD
jgi:hypothetical protein